MDCKLVMISVIKLPRRTWLDWYRDT